MAFRCALDKRISAAVCYFATDIHSKSLGNGGDDSLERAGEVCGEVVMVSGTFIGAIFGGGGGGGASRPGKGGGGGALGGICGNVKTDQGQIFGKKDNHVPPSGRDLIRKSLHDKGVCFSFYEVAHAQRLSSSPCLTYYVPGSLSD